MGHRCFYHVMYTSITIIIIITIVIMIMIVIIMIMIIIIIIKSISLSYRVIFYLFVYNNVTSMYIFIGCCL